LNRVNLLSDVGCLEIALDLQRTLDPQNSLERLLCGQLAASHVLALKFMAAALDQAEPSSWAPNRSADGAHVVEACRLANTAARLMSSFQEGMLALQRLRSGGKQVVVVQHVQVSTGGQAVVAGEVTTGGPGTAGGGYENGGTIPCPERSPRPPPRRAVRRKRGTARSVNSLPSPANDAIGC